MHKQMYALMLSICMVFCLMLPASALVRTRPADETMEIDVYGYGANEYGNIFDQVEIKGATLKAWFSDYGYHSCFNYKRTYENGLSYNLAETLWQFANGRYIIYLRSEKRIKTVKVYYGNNLLWFYEREISKTNEVGNILRGSE